MPEILDQMPVPTAALEPMRMSDEEFLANYENERCELIDGYVREMPVPSFKHGKICNLIAFLLTKWVLEHSWGHVSVNDSLVRLGEGNYRGPDVILISFDRLPKEAVPEGTLLVVPELVVEVKSPSETWNAILSKAILYIDAGVRVVILLDPERQTASTYRTNAEQTIFGIDDKLTIPDILPGFEVRLGDLFGV